jgi:hypothetical protein
VSVVSDERANADAALALSVLNFALLIDFYIVNRAKNVITSLLKRLVHRNPNVQIFALEVCY